MQPPKIKKADDGEDENTTKLTAATSDFSELGIGWNDQDFELSTLGDKFLDETEPIPGVKLVRYLQENFLEIQKECIPQILKQDVLWLENW